MSNPGSVEDIIRRAADLAKARDRFPDLRPYVPNSGGPPPNPAWFVSDSVTQENANTIVRLSTTGVFRFCVQVGTIYVLEDDGLYTREGGPAVCKVPRDERRDAFSVLAQLVARPDLRAHIASDVEHKHVSLSERPPRDVVTTASASLKEEAEAAVTAAEEAAAFFESPTNIASATEPVPTVLVCWPENRSMATDWQFECLSGLRNMLRAMFRATVVATAGDGNAPQFTLVCATSREGLDAAIDRAKELPLGSDRVVVCNFAFRECNATGAVAMNEAGIAITLGRINVSLPPAFRLPPEQFVTYSELFASDLVARMGLYWPHVANYSEASGRTSIEAAYTSPPCASRTQQIDLWTERGSCVTLISGAHPFVSSRVAGMSVFLAPMLSLRRHRPYNRPPIEKSITIGCITRETVEDVGSYTVLCAVDPMPSAYSSNVQRLFQPTYADFVALAEHINELLPEKDQVDPKTLKLRIKRYLSECLFCVWGFR